MSSKKLEIFLLVRKEAVILVEEDCLELLVVLAAPLIRMHLKQARDLDYLASE